MGYGIKVHVWGERACFTRPEMKAERVSYDVMTPSAARGILEAIHWKPAIRWIIDRIHVLKPIRFESIRRNEVGSKISAGSIFSAMKLAPLRASHLRSLRIASSVLQRSSKMLPMLSRRISR
jgi:CRISPR-associated protein Cas5d